MAFKRKVDFLQRERDEIPARRPLLLYITAPSCSKDYTLLTSQHKHFKYNPSHPEGVLKREGNPFNFCLIEASPEVYQFELQVLSALKEYKEAAHKVVVINGHGEASGGIFLKNGGDGEETVVLDGRHFGDLVTPYTHGKTFHVFIFASYGHIFSDQLYQFVQKSCPVELTSTFAITYFTSKDSPTAWDKIATAGNGHVEVTRDIREFIKSKIEPNSPYKILETKIKPQCVIL